MTETAKQIEAVADAIRKAFKDSKPHSSSSGGLLNHEEAVQFRDDLWSLTKDDLQYYLPQILIDLLYKHDNPSDLKNLESLMRFLNILPEPISLASNREEHELEEEQYKRLKSAKLEVLGDLNRAQAAAIKDWLKIASGWSDMDEYCRREAAEALTYWDND